MKGMPVPSHSTSFASAAKDWQDRIAHVDPRSSSVAFMVVAAGSVCADRTCNGPTSYHTRAYQFDTARVHEPRRPENGV